MVALFRQVFLNFSSSIRLQVNISFLALGKPFACRNRQFSRTIYEHIFWAKCRLLFTISLAILLFEHAIIRNASHKLYNSQLMCNLIKHRFKLRTCGLMLSLVSLG